MDVAKARLFSPLLPRLSDTASLDVDFKIEYVALFQERHGKNKSKAVAFLHFLLKPCPTEKLLGSHAGWNS